VPLDTARKHAYSGRTELGGWVDPKRSLPPFVPRDLPSLYHQPSISCFSP